jgi:hypothetical protein
MKTPAISENTVVSPPRMLVNQLLHAAQLRPLQIHWGIISMHNGKPAHCEYLDTNSRNAEEFHQALRKVTARNPEQVWALFCLTPGDAETPGPDELTPWGYRGFWAYRSQPKVCCKSDAGGPTATVFGNWK